MILVTFSKENLQMLTSRRSFLAVNSLHEGRGYFIVLSKSPKIQGQGALVCKTPHSLVFHCY